jgi:hypothetical protein
VPKGKNLLVLGQLWDRKKRAAVPRGATHEAQSLTPAARSKRRISSQQSTKIAQDESERRIQKVLRVGKIQAWIKRA